MNKKDNLIENKFSLACIQHQKGNLNKAENLYQEILKINPKHCQTLGNLGYLFYQIKNYDKAKYFYKKALKFKSNYLEIYYNLGILFIDIKKYDDAIYFFKKSIKINPNFYKSYYCLGNIYFDLGNMDDCIYFLQEAIKLNPKDIETLNNLGIAYKEIGENKTAIEFFKKIIKINSNYAKPYYNLYSLLINNKDLNESITCLKKAVKIDSNNDTYNFFLGFLLEYYGNVNESKKFFNKINDNLNINIARIDSWNYIKNFQKKIPKIIKNTNDAFKIATNAAPQFGLVLEFGVSYGNSIKQISKLVSSQIHGFDSFQGLPEQWKNEPKGTYSTKGIIPRLPKNILLHIGLFKNTIPKFLVKYKENIRLINIDCDLYSSTNTILNLLSNKIVSGTIIIFDEYLGNVDWRKDEYKSFKEAVKQYKWKYEYLAFSIQTKQVVIKII